MAAARRLIFAKGNDSHDYKFSSAVLEDVHSLPAVLRPKFMAASMYNLKGSDDRDNDLIRRAIKSREDDPRMPAILDDDAWSTWLGEQSATLAAAKAVLKTMEGVSWQAAPEPKKPRPRKP